VFSFKTGRNRDCHVIGHDVLHEPTLLTDSFAASGHRTFEHSDLHTLEHGVTNPYRRVMKLVGGELSSVLDKDGIFPVLAFGDAGSVDHASGCTFIGEARGFGEVDRLYCDFVADSRVVKSGPTSFEGVIRYAIDHVKKNGNRFHTLLIVTDGQINDTKEVDDGKGGWTKQYPTIDAIVEASQYPIEIIVVGVGDGPWEQMQQLDDEIDARSAKGAYRVDCVQFVEFTPYMRIVDRKLEERFMVDCLQEVPQLKAWLDENGKLGPGAVPSCTHPAPVSWTPVPAAATAPL
jgi:E3 ubiquitin-protein ligase RGLG